MSVQFGRWNFDGEPIDAGYIAKVRGFLAPYAPDSITTGGNRAFFVLYGAFHSTDESRHERQPSLSTSRAYLTWTGRLDNRSELLERTNRHSAPGITDFDIVSSLYAEQGTEAFGHFIGDWSLSALHHDDKTLILAVDFLGTQPLHYLHCDRYIVWSSILEPLVVLADRTFTLSEEYVAGWLCDTPAAFLTPYTEIRSVPPGASAEITQRGTSLRKYWGFDSTKRLRLSDDSEYEAGFRHFFTQAVRRRLRSSGPVVAELSGGMDSSSIVCVADRILDAEPNLAARLDTLSYLDDTEPDWDERPFVTAIETARGGVGLHVDVSIQRTLIPEPDPARFSATPAGGGSPSEPQQQVSEHLRRTGSRVVLSGFGGDESTGGVPTGIPELADLIARARLVTFCRRALEWSLAARCPISHTVGGAISEFLPMRTTGIGATCAKVPWLKPTFIRRAWAPYLCAAQRLRIFGPIPSFQENLHALDDLQRKIACFPRENAPVRDRRYPFLDRDLLEFLYSVPREQIVRPGRRRSLMRRALRAIVPDTVLERRRKAYIVRGPLKSVQMESPRLYEWTKQMLCASIGAINLGVFQSCLKESCRGNEIYLWRIDRTLALESWLRDSRVQCVLRLPATCQPSADSGNQSALDRLTAHTSPQLGNPN